MCPEQGDHVGKTWGKSLRKLEESRENQGKQQTHENQENKGKPGRKI